MYAVIAAIVHAVISTIAAMAIAPYSLDPAANDASMRMLSITSAFISAIGMVATASYLSRRIRTISGVVVGILCGVLCSGILGLTIRGTQFSLILYLAILAPTLLAVLLATLLDKPKSGWQS
jgi:hypothetical protein